jgi:hypothetical protein
VKPRLIYSMSVSVDGFIADREGAFGWTAPSEELFRFHLAQVRELGGYVCGRRLCETMLVWETLDSVQGDAQVAAALDATDKDVSIGGAGLAAAAIEHRRSSHQRLAGPSSRRAEKPLAFFP